MSDHGENPSEAAERVKALKLGPRRKPYAMLPSDSFVTFSPSKLTICITYLAAAVTFWYIMDDISVERYMRCATFKRWLRAAFCAWVKTQTRSRLVMSMFFLYSHKLELELYLIVVTLLCYADAWESIVCFRSCWEWCRVSKSASQNTQTKSLWR
jgi:hypothetical protein